MGDLIHSRIKDNPELITTDSRTIDVSHPDYSNSLKRPLTTLPPTISTCSDLQIPFSPECLAGVAFEASQLARGMVKRGELLVLPNKDDNSKVTNVDLAVSNFLKGRLTELVEALVISEEEIPDWEVRRLAKTAWLIDPIDYTEGLVQGKIEKCGINIALLIEGEPVVGLAYYFADDISMIGIKGVGAFEASTNSIKPLELKTANAPLRFVGYKETLTEMTSETRQILESVLIDDSVLVCGNRLPLRLRAVVSGEADVYIERRMISEWDIVPAFAIISALGGSGVSLEDGSPIRFNGEELKAAPFLLAGPGVRVDEILGRIRSVA